VIVFLHIACKYVTDLKRSASFYFILKDSFPFDERRILLNGLTTLIIKILQTNILILCSVNDDLNLAGKFLDVFESVTSQNEEEHAEDD
jgi:E3 ubiquitin-protein ligase DOA10